MIRIGIIGHGAFGATLTKKFNESNAFNIQAVCDINLRHSPAVCCPHRVTTDYRDIVRAVDIDAVVVATPASTHFDLAFEAIRAGKHVWVEKPISTTFEQAERLSDAAAKGRRVLFVDHTPIYGAAPSLLSELVNGGALGRVARWRATRANTGRHQRDVNVFWDLAVHDLATLEYVLGPAVRQVSATAKADVQGLPESVGTLTCTMDSGEATIDVSWFSERVVRQTTVQGDRRTAVWDAAPEQEMLFSRDTADAAQPSASHGTDETPVSLPQIDALGSAMAQFASSIEKGKAPITDGRFGSRLVKILEAADRSLARGGAPIRV